jgi:alpha-L-arabinofuranosidase
VKKILRLILGSLCLAALAPVAHAQTSITVQADSPGIQISSNLFGIFFEEISLAGDGGIYAEMVRNRSLDNSGSPDYWTLVTTGTAAGSRSLDSSLPLNTNNLCSLKLTMTSGTGSVGAGNAGFWGMALTQDAVYDLSFYACSTTGFTGDLTARLESANGSTNYAQTSFSGLTTNWQRFAASLTPSATDTNARLVLSITNAGTVWLDVVSLFPQATFHSRTNGMRPDLANMLVAMRPSFMRFPGGCYVEGNVLANAFRWKNTIGDIAARPGHYNGVWGYRSTDGLGYHEYLQLCEDLGAEPLFVINCGMAHGDTVPLDQMGPWVQDALDAIEYANGDTNTTWGAQRVANGHPSPFNLKYMEIGNENSGTSYNDRYALFYDTIKSNYPNMHLVADVYSTSRPVEIADEHYYTTPATMASLANQYNSYSRSGPKIYVGEYAVTSGGGYGNLAGALGEAAFMTGMERNSDVVLMASYAPLFENVHNINWHPNAIRFDNSRVFGTPSYYVQQMFSLNRGDRVLPTVVSPSTALYVSSSLLQSNDQIIVKAVNFSSTSVTTQLRIVCARGLETNAITTVLTSANTLDENSFSQPTLVAPVTNTISGVSTNFQYTFPSNSLTIFRFQKLPPPPVAGFSASPTNGVAPLAVTFANTSTGSITSGFWNFGDGNTTNTTDTSLSYTYSTGGTYTVSLTMSGPGGSNTSTRSNYIVVLNPAQLVVSPASLNFGSVTIGQTNSLNFYVINTGSVSLSGTATSAAPFRVTSGSSYTVLPGQTQTVTVAFTPAAPGATTGSVVFASNGGDSTNGATGVGVCGYALTANSASSPAKGGTNTVYVITTSLCPWTATPSNVWLTIVSGRSGVSSGAVTYVVAPNGSSNARTGMVSIAGQPFMVTQSGNTAPQVTITPVSPVTLPVRTVNLNATATDSDGAPYGTLSTTWSKVSGGGSVVFSNVNAISTTATFSTNGTYVLRLTASDGALSTGNNVTVIVNATPGISTPPAVTNALAQVDGLTVAAGGEPACFIVGMYDPDTNSLSCLWDFGDGVPITDCNPCHVFTNCGQYAVSVVVSDGLASTNATSLVTIACQLALTKLQVKLNFAKTNSDSCTLSGVLDLGAGFNPASEVVTLDIGGVQVPFTLDAKGRGVSSFGRCTLAYNKKTKQWTLSANLAKGTWRTQWAAHGLANRTIPKPGVWVTIPVVVVIGDGAFADERPMLYTAMFNKSGLAK